MLFTYLPLTFSNEGGGGKNPEQSNKHINSRASQNKQRSPDYPPGPSELGANPEIKPR